MASTFYQNNQGRQTYTRREVGNGHAPPSDIKDTIRRSSRRQAARDRAVSVPLTGRQSSQGCPLTRAPCGRWPLRRTPVARAGRLARTAEDLKARPESLQQGGCKHGPAQAARKPAGAVPHLRRVASADAPGQGSAGAGRDGRAGSGPLLGRDLTVTGS